MFVVRGALHGAVAGTGAPLVALAPEKAVIGSTPTATRGPQRPSAPAAGASARARMSPESPAAAPTWA